MQPLLSLAAAIDKKRRSGLPEPDTQYIKDFESATILPRTVNTPNQTWSSPLSNHSPFAKVELSKSMTAPRAYQLVSGTDFSSNIVVPPIQRKLQHSGSHSLTSNPKPSSMTRVSRLFSKTTNPSNVRNSHAFFADGKSILAWTENKVYSYEISSRSKSYMALKDVCFAAGGSNMIAAIVLEVNVWLFWRFCHKMLTMS